MNQDAIHVGYETLLVSMTELIESFPESERSWVRDRLIVKYKAKLADSGVLNGRVLSEVEKDAAERLYLMVIKYLEGGQS